MINAGNMTKGEGYQQMRKISNHSVSKEALNKYKAGFSLKHLSYKKCLDIVLCPLETFN